MFGASFCLLSIYACNLLDGYGTDIHIFFVFAASICRLLKKRYHNHVERVKDYLETVKDFNKLISP